MTTDITELAQRVKTEASAIDDTQWYLAKPSEIRSLVEALEKAHAENTAGVAGMAESYETNISMLRSRIAELESRTVKLPPAVAVADWMVDIDVYEADLVRALLTAAGIKMEVE
ncbi:hypothetical protein [Raoultella ornithinolytica]|uniref:hypothetical protein n=1 Tax=Raoultella ornithinolytica TaxID=54291 RepID=UPI001F308D27|nr:hypothetical protein [Raoultella ornithinolytica]MCF1305003.1 hypothetical protein [Raoultella ornithinolytica]